LKKEEEDRIHHRNIIEEREKIEDRMSQPAIVRDGSQDTEATDPEGDDFKDEKEWGEELYRDPEWRDLVLHKQNKKDLTQMKEKNRTRLLNKSEWYDFDGLLSYWKYDGETVKKLTVVPYKFRLKILNLYHDGELGGHRGKKALKEILLRKYYWPGMTRDVGKYVDSCRACALAKASWRRDRGMKGTFGLEPAKWEILHIDHVGRLNRTSHGHSYILTMIDRFTGWCECIPTCDKSIPTAAKIIYDRWVTQRGAPQMIVSDNAFKTEVMKEMGKICGFKQGVTSAYHPQANGKVERLHRDMKAYLKIWGEKSGEWDRCLPGFVFAHNNTPSRRDGYSPAFLAFGREMRYPADIIHEEMDWADEETQVSRMFSEMKLTYKIVEARRRKNNKKKRKN
jgi:hypothetical protein